MALDIDRIEKPIRKMQKLLKRMPAEPTPKQVHDPRTNARRVEMMLKATDPRRSDRKLLKRLSKTRKRAGKVRDMDVLTAYALELPHEGDEKDCSVRLVEHLGTVRGRKARKLYRTAQEYLRGIRKSLKRSSKHLRNMVTRPEIDGSSRITSTVLQPLSELEQPAKLNFCANSRGTRKNDSRVHSASLKT